MFEFFSDFAREFSRIDAESLTILLVMVGWATLLIQIGIQSTAYALLFVPGLFLGGMSAFYLSHRFLLSFSASHDINAILLSLVGMIAGLAVTTAIISVFHWLAERRRPLTLHTRT